MTKYFKNECNNRHIQNMSEIEKTIEESSERPDYVKGQIYLITNTINGKKYVGQTLTHTLNHGKYRPFGYVKRFENHVSEAIRNVKKNQCTYLNTAIRKYGKDVFSVELLEDDCEISNLDVLEITYIDEYESFHETGKGYNLTKGGHGTSRMTEDMRAKISETLTTRFSDMEERKKLIACHWKRYDNDSYNILKIIKPIRIHISKDKRASDTVILTIPRNGTTDNRIQIYSTYHEIYYSVIRSAIIVSRWLEEYPDCSVSISDDIQKCMGVLEFDDIEIPDNFYPSNKKEIKPRQRADTYKESNIEDREKRYYEMDIIHATASIRSVKGYNVIQFDIYENGNPKKHQSTFGGRHETFEEWCDRAVKFLEYLYTESGLLHENFRVIGNLNEFISSCNEEHPIKKILTCHEILWL
jgi:hypothetical protein